MREQPQKMQAWNDKLAKVSITCGSLLLMWSAVWLLDLILPGRIAGSTCLAGGIILSGIAVVVIGAKMRRVQLDSNEHQRQFA